MLLSLFCSRELGLYFSINRKQRKEVIHFLYSQITGPRVSSMVFFFMLLRITWIFVTATHHLHLFTIMFPGGANIR